MVCLWFFQASDFVKTADAPEPQDASAAEAEVSLGEDEGADAGKPAAKGEGT
jgi:hypothetical protein